MDMINSDAWIKNRTGKYTPDLENLEIQIGFGWQKLPNLSLESKNPLIK